MTGKYKGLRSYSQKDAVTAPRKIQRGGKTETLSYINDEEASVLKRLGGSGERTQYGGVPSYNAIAAASLISSNWDAISSAVSSG